VSCVLPNGKLSNLYVSPRNGIGCVNNRQTCENAYSFRHILSLTNDVEEFSVSSKC